jgi:tetratricopeptide (TPR) repeat protein
MLALLISLTLTMSAIDIDDLWEYADPAASEQRFRAALADAQGDAALELQTQLARTYSLRKRFDDAHRLLDDIEPQLARAGAAPRVRYLLERGRTFNSAGDKPRARALFEDAFKLGQSTGLQGLAVDAAHMVAITHRGSEAAVEWNRRGLALARASSDPKARSLIPAMLNNSAWDLLDQGRAGEALPWFDDALAAWRERARPAQIRIAQWSRAHVLRKLGRHADALAQLEQLRAEHGDAAERDGFVHEEQGENLLAWAGLPTRRRRLRRPRVGCRRTPRSRRRTVSACSVCASWAASPATKCLPPSGLLRAAWPSGMPRRLRAISTTRRCSSAAARCCAARRR